MMYGWSSKLKLLEFSKCSSYTNNIKVSYVYFIKVSKDFTAKQMFIRIKRPLYFDSYFRRSTNYM